jgi:hypothetical protein
MTRCMGIGLAGVYVTGLVCRRECLPRCVSISSHILHDTKSKQPLAVLVLLLSLCVVAFGVGANYAACLQHIETQVNISLVTVTGIWNSSSLGIVDTQGHPTTDPNQITGLTFQLAHILPRIHFVAPTLAGPHFPASVRHEGYAEQPPGRPLDGRIPDTGSIFPTGWIIQYRNGLWQRLCQFYMSPWPTASRGSTPFQALFLPSWSMLLVKAFRRFGCASCL